MVAIDKITVLAIANAEFAKRRRKKHKVEGYMQVVNLYGPDDFKSHFRMHRHTMESLVQLITDNVESVATGRPQFRIENQCLIFIWTLANQESYRSISDRFNVSKATVFYILRRISGILLSLTSKIIQWPNENRAKKIIQKFKAKANFPGVIGAIDGSHIPILPPTENSVSYVNRKGFPSMILQAICDHKCRFIHCFAGFPGSVHDARVFCLSEVSTYCLQDRRFPFNSHLLGDAAYPIGPHLLTPFRDDGCLTAKKRKYNEKHAKTRVVIERAFGILKARWRRLHYLEMRCSILLPRVILATCMLHNWCILLKDEFEDDGTATYPVIGLEEQISANSGQQKTQGIEKRNCIVNEL